MEPNAPIRHECDPDPDRRVIASFIAQVAYDLARMAARAKLPELVHYLNAAQLEAQMSAGGPEPAQR